MLCMQWEAKGSSEIGHALTDCHPPGLLGCSHGGGHTEEGQNERGAGWEATASTQEREDGAWDLGGGNRDEEEQTALGADTGQNSETGIRNLSEKEQ